MNVNNGDRVQVSMLGYEGSAGLIKRPDVDEISFPARFRALPVHAGATVTVAGEARTVLSVTASQYLPNFVVIQLAKQVD